MKLSYFELLSAEPVQVPGAAGIISPRLRDISSIGYQTYQYYLTIIAMDLKNYFTITGSAMQYSLLSEEEKSQINIFGLLTINEESSALLQNILNFFIKENVLYSSESRCFTVSENGSAVGKITKDNYSRICDLICQRNCVKPNQEEDLSKAKNKKALEIMKKIQKGRSDKEKQEKNNRNMELGNIISAVANKSQSLNILNIWELTIYQLWDCFLRLSNNTIYDIQSMSVAAWGNKENYFDTASWFKRIDNDN